MIVVGIAALVLLGANAVLLFAILRQRAQTNPQTNLDAIRQLIERFGLAANEYARQLGQTASQYAEGSAVLSLARKIQEQPELVDGLPRRVAEMLAADVALQTESLTRRAQIVRNALEEAQRKAAANRGSRLFPTYEVSISDHEAELERLGGQLALMQGLAQAAKRATQAG